MQAYEHRTGSRWHNDFEENVPALSAHEQYGIDKILINIAYSSESVEKDQEEDCYGCQDHFHLYINAEPQNEEGSQRHFWDAVDCDDKRIKNLRQRLLKS